MQLSLKFQNKHIMHIAQVVMIQLFKFYNISLFFKFRVYKLSIYLLLLQIGDLIFLRDPNKTSGSLKQFAGWLDSSFTV